MMDRASQAVELPATRAAPRLGREFVRTVLVDWGVADLVDTAALLASEILTNAVVHAGTSTTLSIQRDRGAVRIAVVDGGPGGVRRRSPRPGIAGGHGLSLVEQLARRWGAGRVAAGHEVWFDLEVAPGERPPDDEEMA